MNTQPVIKKNKQQKTFPNNLKDHFYVNDLLIMEYINNVISPQVNSQQNGKLLNVPLSWANFDIGIKSKIIEPLKDKNNKYILPIIFINRTGEQLDTTVYNDSIRTYNFNNIKKNTYKKNNKIINTKINNLLFYTFTYEISILANSTVELNQIKQNIIIHNRLYWTDASKKMHMYVKLDESMNNDIKNDSKNSQKWYRTNITFTAHGKMYTDFKKIDISHNTAIAIVK